jgi:hypothetical protein
MTLEVSFADRGWLFLGAIEEARDCFNRVYAILSPAQQRLLPGYGRRP